MKKNIIANFIGKFWSILSNFLFIPLYIHFLGFDSYSIISFTLLIFGIMAILDAGLTATLSREFARSDVSHIEKVRIFKTLEFVYLLIVAVAITIVFFLSEIIGSHWLTSHVYTTDQISDFIKIISFDLGLQLLLRFYSGGLFGLEKQVKANMYQIGWGITRNAFIILVIMFCPDLTIFFLWQTISTIIFTLFIKSALNRELMGTYRLTFSIRMEKSVFFRVWPFAGGMLLIAIVAAFNTQMDKIVISKLLSIENLGYYTLAIALSQSIVVIINPISTALLPRFTSQYSQEKTQEASSLFCLTNLIVSILVFSIMSNMIFFSKELIWAWAGNINLAQKISLYLPVISISMSMLALVNLPYNIAIANGYTKLNNILGLTSLFVTIPGYWISTRIYGAIGAATIFCVVQIFTTFIYLYFINKKFIKMNFIKDICIRQILFPMVLSLVITFLFSVFSSFMEESRVASLVMIIISSFFTLLITSLILLPFRIVKNIFKLKFSSTT